MPLVFHGVQMVYSFDWIKLFSFSLIETTGQSIAVMQDPPAVSLHSLQDGRLFLTLTTERSLDSGPEERNPQLTGIWWFRHEINYRANSNIPRYFQEK